MPDNDETGAKRHRASAQDGPSPTDISAVALVKEIGSEVNHLVSKQLELATTELRADLKREAGVLAGLGVAGLAVLATINLLLVTAVLATYTGCQNTTEHRRANLPGCLDCDRRDGCSVPR